MDIRRNGSQPSGKGQADYFTGTVRIDPLFDAHEPAHGATGTTAMTHISIVELLDGKSADWMEKVSDEQYQAGFKAE